MTGQRWNVRVAPSVFSLVGAVVSALRRDGCAAEVEEFRREIRQGLLTEEAVLRVAAGYVEIGSQRRRGGR